MQNEGGVALAGDDKYDIGSYNVDHITDEDVERILQITDQADAFDELMMYYDCAMTEVRTKLEVLNKEMALRNKRNPFEYIKSRLKAPRSIYGKLKGKGVPFTVENIENTINDIAGIRVICSFIDDIYNIRDSFDVQDDVEIIQEKDYIASPKGNGYRSLHLIIRVPIFLSNEKKFMNVELQFRTIAMDFWASVEHKMKYKREIRNAEIIVEELRYSADLINQLDRRMLQIRERIEVNEESSDRRRRREE
jgi:putative GTP pyrophosphokinase